MLSWRSRCPVATAGCRDDLDDALGPTRRSRGGERVKAPKAKKLTGRQRAELSALEALPNDQIDTSDIPEVRDWSDAKRGLFHRPVKRRTTTGVLGES